MYPVMYMSVYMNTQIFDQKNTRGVKIMDN